ncbi:unnamed protein product [Orchesella dallaii]|uniref:Anhydro-N-acetylmuramic acid kinase n=1 Tax=Orchesella dallaii TaxID=48710 RepID=A0ABP1RRC9_9HEXA
MAKNINQLHKISNSTSRSIIGLMSGTSLDGLDIAHCVFQHSGPDTKVELLNFATIPYDIEIKSELRKLASVRNVDLEHLCNVNSWLAKIHGEMILTCLSEWKVDPISIDLIASHGQTIFHSPKDPHSNHSKFSNSTLQIVDGDHLAVTTGIITISDFRQKHVAGGGEGAPLALYGDYCIFSKAGENRIMLNIGGISNITCIYGDLDSSKAFASDLGPGNTLIDNWAREYFNVDCDHNSEISLRGNVNHDLLAELKNHEFFHRPFPKTTGPELFNLKFVQRALDNLAKPCDDSGNLVKVDSVDILRTLTQLSADVIVSAILSLDNYKSFRVYVSGGGAHNPLLMSEIRRGLQDQVDIGTTDELGIPGDAKEAVLFAVLANETVCGDPTEYSFGMKSKMPSVSMGKISFPC